MSPLASIHQTERPAPGDDNTGQLVLAHPTTLAKARTQDCFTVAGFCDSADLVVTQRLQDLGFREGATVKCLRRAPLGSPLMFRVCDTDICLRKQQAALIRVS